MGRPVSGVGKGEEMEERQAMLRKAPYQHPAGGIQAGGLGSADVHRLALEMGHEPEAGAPHRRGSACRAR